MSSKKHKKHHKLEKSLTEGFEGGGSLKLVLKVGTPDSMEATPPEEHAGTDLEKRHKHKKKKKKHKHHHEERREKRRHEKDTDDAELSEVDGGDLVGEEPPKKKAAPSGEVLELPPVRKERLRDRRPEDGSQSTLQVCLDYLHKLLVRKDVNGFFSFPVTDSFAPGYSNIIEKAMDFSTMKHNIDNNEYSSVVEYKLDFKMMCDNCMRYNHPETIYYREAKKLRSIGLKQLSKEKILQMKHGLPDMANITESDIGIDEDELKAIKQGEQPAPPKPAPKPKVKPPKPSKFEAIPDNMTSEEILEQAQAAAKEAADRLTLRRPRANFSFLRRREDGSTSLNILNPENDGIVSEKERIVDLGTMLGKLQSGSGTLQGMKEDRRQKANTVTYLNYGPFSSYAPVYDSSTANLSKEDSDLLLSTYGDETGIQYSKSVRTFVENCGDYAVKMVDNLLDLLTSRDHSKTVKAIEVKQKEEEERKKKEEKERKQQMVPEIKSEDGQGTNLVEVKTEAAIDFDSLRSLTDLGIDMTFMDDLEKDLKKKEALQQKLDQTSELLQDLQKTQYERLGASLPAHLAHVPGPTDKEKQLALKVTEELKALVREAAPQDIMSGRSIRETMGISFDPLDDLDLESSSSSSSSSSGGGSQGQAVSSEGRSLPDQGDEDVTSTVDILDPGQGQDPKDDLEGDLKALIEGQASFDPVDLPEVTGAADGQDVVSSSGQEQHLMDTEVADS